MLEFFIDEAQPLLILNVIGDIDAFDKNPGGTPIAVQNWRVDKINE